MWRWILGIVLFIGVAASMTFVYVFGPTDEQLIQEALEESIQASREGSSGGVLSRLASNFTYNNEGIGARTDAARWIQTLRPEISVFSREIIKDGEKARIVTPVKVTFAGGINVDLETVTVTFKKSTGTRYVVFPYADWQIESVVSEGFDPSSFMPMGLP